MGKIRVIEIDGEKQYAKKDFLGWRIVDPIIEPETRKIIWKNFFNKKGFLSLFILILVIGTAWLGYKEQIENYRMVVRNPCSLCEDCQDYVREKLQDYSWKDQQTEVDFSGIKIVNSTRG